MMEENLHQEVIDMIRFGDLDLHLVAIEEACKRRGETILGQKTPPMCPKCGGFNGQHKDDCSTKQKPQKPWPKRGGTVVVRPDAQISPRYMRGKIFTVIRVNATTITVGPVPNQPRYGRFAGQKSVRIPKSALTLVS